MKLGEIVVKFGQFCRLLVLWLVPREGGLMLMLLKLGVNYVVLS